MSPVTSSLDAVLDRVRPRRYLRPRSVGRRVVTLLRVLDLWAPDTLTPEIVPALARLARHPWRRPVDLWRGGTLSDLVAHLLITVRYPLPGFLMAAALSRERRYPTWVDRDAELAMALLAAVGRGDTPRQVVGALLPYPFTRRTWHLWWTTEGTPTAWGAIRAAQVAAAGGPSTLAGALAPTLLGGPTPDEGWWGRALTWMAGQSVEHDQLRAVVDYLEARRRGGHPPPTSTWSSVVRACREWHGRPPIDRMGPDLPLPRSGIASATLTVDDARWSFRELASTRVLVLEGWALAHCVATYVPRVRSGRCAIFGLLRDGERALTVEVRMPERAIVQARGLRNRRPSAVEEDVLRRWAATEGLAVHSW
ncbi:MAG: PcfJ domain-containing protein [Alphaproteobacteria bacterium]|nr:PcfJ domain-containing protein [Alphaproteobacteria bacterium]